MDSLRFWRETYRPGKSIMDVYYKLWLRGFNLAKHFLLHLTGVRCGRRNIIHVDIAGSCVAMGIKTDFRFGTKDGDAAARQRMLADVPGELRRGDERRTITVDYLANG